MVESNRNKEIIKHNPVSVGEKDSSGEDVTRRKVWKCFKCKRVKEFDAEKKLVQVVCNVCQEEMVEMTLGGWGG